MIRSTIFISQTIALINYYGFDLEEYTVKQLMVKWSKAHEHSWLYLAVIEAIYQGRFKAISVEQILSLWSRKGTPHYHFNIEFEKLICTNVTSNLEETIGLDEDFFQVINNHPQTSPPLNSRVQKNNCLPLVLYHSPITQFKPLEDYSHCYSKLKALAESP